MNKLFYLSIIFLASKAGAQTSALSLADSLYAVGKYPDAIEQLESIKLMTDAVYIKLAKAQQASGNPSAALESYHIVLKQSPERVLTALDYGKLLSSTGELRKADSLFYSLTRKHPDNAAFHYQLALVREKRKDSTATNHFNMTVILDKSHQQALFRVAKDHLSHRRYAQAEHYSKQGLKTNPTNPSLLSILAQTHYNQKEYEPAIEYFSKLVELGHGSGFVHAKLGYANFQLERFPEAIEQYNLALDYEDQNHATHYSLGKLYALIGEYESSEGHLLTAILLKDQLLDAEFLSLGLTYKFLEQPKKALEYFNKSLEENPDNERALFERAIAADSYFEDLETRRNYYQAYLNRFEDSGNQRLVRLAKIRVQDIREEMHLDQ